MYDSIIVGCGFAGAVVARELAERGGQMYVLLKNAIISAVTAMIYMTTRAF